MQKSFFGVIGMVAIVLIGCFAIGLGFGGQQGNVELVKVQATIESEKAKAAQIRETYEGIAKVEDEKAETYQVESQADLFAYLVRSNVEMNKEMLFYLMHKETKEQREAKYIRYLTISIFGVLVFAAVGAWVVSVFGNPNKREAIKSWIRRNW
jgi:hypothetical protein